MRLASCLLDSQLARVVLRAQGVRSEVPCLDAFAKAGQRRRIGSMGKPSAGERLSVAGLFAGIGGIELGLKAAGHETVVLCEIDPGAASVLTTRFRDVPLSRDV